MDGHTDFLREQTRWIRDKLDPQVARNGPDALHPDDVLVLDEFLRQLLDTPLDIEQIRSSRIHLAVLDIIGRATRWPKRLIDRCEALASTWREKHGPLEALKILLYEPGGRLYGVCQPTDVDKDKLMIEWLKSPTVRLRPYVSRRSGHLDFKPGDWWINPLFAFLDGIIDSGDTAGGITADGSAAYAVLMTGEDELAGDSPETFTYRASTVGRGRYRLTAATPDSRMPVRILRSHTLQSFWSPRAGVRYDGLYRVIGWRIRADQHASGDTTYHIDFQRLSTETSIQEVLKRPWTDEVEDYKEYKQQRALARQRQTALTTANTPKLLLSPDGSFNEDADTENVDLPNTARRNAIYLKRLKGAADALQTSNEPPLFRNIDWKL